MWLKIILVGLVAVAIAASGCGGGGDDSGTGAASTAEATNAASDANEAGSTSGDGASTQADGQPLTKAQLIKAGDKICQRTAAKIVEDWQREKENYGRGFGAQPSQKQNEEGIVDLVLPVIQEEAEEIAELVPSPGEEAEIDAIVAALEKGVAQTEANPSLAASVGAKNPLDEASKLSKAYGFKVCGS